MQPPSQSAVIVPLGAPVKSSLMVAYARQVGFQYFEMQEKHTAEEIAQHITDKAVSPRVVINNVKAELQTLISIEARLSPNKFYVVQFGSPETDELKQICKYYERIGRLKRVELSNSQSEGYTNLRRAMSPKVIFVYGPPLAGKTEIANKISECIGYQYCNLSSLFANVFREQNGIVATNKFIEHCWKRDTNLIVDGFFNKVEELQVLEQYIVPFRLLHIAPSKQATDSNCKSLKNAEHRTAKIAEFKEFLKNERSLVDTLKKKPYYVKLNPLDRPLLQAAFDAVDRNIVFIKNSSPKFVEDFSKSWNAIYLNPSEIIASEIQRKTAVGLQIALLSQFGGGVDVGLQTVYPLILQHLKSIIYNLDKNIVLSGLPNTIYHLGMLQTQIGQLLAYVVQPTEEYQYSQEYTAQMAFLKQQELIVLPNPNPQQLLNYLSQAKPYIIVVGPQACGKTVLSKQIAKDYGYKHIEFEPYLASIKQKLVTAEDGDEIPVGKVIKHFKELMEKQKEPLLIDGLIYEEKNLLKWLQEVGGRPLIINLKVDSKNLLRRTRKKNQTDVNAEVTEEDTQKMQGLLQKNGLWVKNIEENMPPYARLFQLDFNTSLMTAESLLPSILKRRVFILYAEPPGKQLLFLNIALKYQMDYIDLKHQSIKQIEPLLKKCNQRDLVLSNYYNDNLISDEFNWIEKNVGVVRYVASWMQEDKNIIREKIELVKPVVEAKKKAQNQEGEDKQPEPQPQEQDKKKPKFDIYQQEWSVTGLNHSMTQWFMELKQPNKQIISTQGTAFEDFSIILKEINSDRSINIYHMIK